MDARTRWLSSLLLLFAWLAPLAAQDKLKLEAALQPATARPGDEVELVLTATVEDGWHAYGTKETTNIPVKLKEKNLQLAGLERVGEAKVPPGMLKRSEIGDSFPLPHTFKVTQTLKVPAGFAAGDAVVAGSLDYQVCNENMCLAPAKAAFSVTLKVTNEGGAASAATNVEAPTSGTVPVAQDPVPGTKPGLQLVPDGKFTLKARFEPSTARAGETVQLLLEAHVDAAYHAYGSKEENNTPVTVPADRLQGGGLERAGDAEVPPGELADGPAGKEYRLPHDFTVKQPMRVPADGKPGSVTVRGVVHYGVCDENQCDPPADAEFSATLTIEGGAARAPTTNAPTTGPGTGATSGTAGAQSPTAPDSPFTSWWALILACIGGGLFALAMPCTYPMIPITFSFFTKQAEKRNGNVLTLALTYGFGIVAMFVLVGVSLAGVILPVVNHWVTNAIIGVFFFVFAFALFGWINLNPPASLQQAAGKASRSGGLFGVFFMGATLVITSFTCTAPIVGSLIAKVAELGTLRVGVGMAIFGLTMAIPFVFLSLAPGKVKALPKSGEWMETLKVSLGFVELAAAFKFVSMVDFYFGWQALPRELFLLLWAAIFGLWAMYLFGILRKAGTLNEGVSNGRMAGGMAVTLFAVYFLFGGLGNQLDFYTTNFIPGYSAPSVLTRQEGRAETSHGGAAHRLVLDDGEQALAMALRDDKLLLYNFTGFN